MQIEDLFLFLIFCVFIAVGAIIMIAIEYLIIYFIQRKQRYLKRLDAKH
jgi:hypothetical protein